VGHQSRLLALPRCRCCGRLLLLSLIQRLEAGAAELTRDGKVVGRLGTGVRGAAGEVVERQLAVGGVVVADVVVAALDADEEPADAAAEGLDDVPDVDGIPDGKQAERAAGAGIVLVLLGPLDGARGAVRNGVEGWLGVVEVGAVGEGPEVEDGEEGHLEAQEEGRNADFEVWVGEDLVLVDDVEGGGAEGDGRGLPEGEEDDQLDGKNFQERAVVGEGFAELDVELDNTVHCYCDSDAVYGNSLRRLGGVFLLEHRAKDLPRRGRKRGCWSSRNICGSTASPRRGWSWRRG
jgi:hypothetical protein